MCLGHVRVNGGPKIFYRVRLNPLPPGLPQQPPFAFRSPQAVATLNASAGLSDLTID